jgi:hypothetical protein
VSERPVLPPAEPRNDVDDASVPVAVSLAFWLALLVAAGLYASVSLSPKLIEWNRTRQRYLENAARLITLERRADEAERLIARLRQNPQSASQVNLAAESSAIAGGGQQATAGTATGLLNQPLVSASLNRLAADTVLRRRLLLTAAVLTVLSFTLLNGAPLRPRLPKYGRHWFSRWLRTAEVSPAITEGASEPAS